MVTNLWPRFLAHPVVYMYLYMVSSRMPIFKCSLHHPKCGFHRAANDLRKAYGAPYAPGWIAGKTAEDAKALE